jgi:hypothetical protein
VATVNDYAEKLGVKGCTIRYHIRKGQVFTVEGQPISGQTKGWNKHNTDYLPNELVFSPIPALNEDGVRRRGKLSRLPEGVVRL